MAGKRKPNPKRDATPRNEEARFRLFKGKLLELAAPADAPRKHPVWLQATGELICTRLSAGESLSSICRSPGYPHVATVMKWLREFPDFLRDYEIARLHQAESLAHEALTLSDTAFQVAKEPFIGGARVNALRLMVDTRLELAARMAPKRWSPRTQLTVGGSLSIAAVSAALRVVEPVGGSD